MARQTQHNTTVATSEQAQQRFRRPPRVLPALPNRRVTIPGPPPRPASGGAWFSPTTIVLPLAIAGAYLFMLAPRLAQGGAWLGMTGILVALVSAMASIWSYLRQRAERQRALLSYENDYIDALLRTEDELSRLHHRAAMQLHHQYPAPMVLLSLVREDELLRIGERNPRDPDFLDLRIGLSERPTSLEIVPPQPDHYTPELERAFALADRFATIKQTPISVMLRNYAPLGILGTDEQSGEVAAAIMAQAATLHLPAELRIAAFWPQSQDARWDWLNRLPHCRPLSSDDSYRMLAHSDGVRAPFEQVLHDLLSELAQRASRSDDGRMLPHILVFIHDIVYVRNLAPEIERILQDGRQVGISVICIAGRLGQLPSACGAYLDLSGSPALVMTGPGGYATPFLPDTMSALECRDLARRLARINLAETGGRESLPRQVRLITLLGVSDARQLDLNEYWQHAGEIDLRAVAIGLQPDGRVATITPSERVQGVHGIFVGTTGSGKSEMLLTFLVALAVLHSPDRLNLLLIDFKGGATFGPLANLPHTVGIVTDLDGRSAERALLAINSELDRRKQRFNRVDVANITEYRKAGYEQQHGEDFGPLPNLFIVIDEFDEVENDLGDLIPELIRVAKQGRSLGVHLLLATQQASVVKRGLLRNLNFRLVLRVLETDDSREMLNGPEAAYLSTTTPGRGYLRVDRQIQLLQGARVSLPARPAASGMALSRLDVTGRPIPIPLYQDRTTATEVLTEVLADTLLQAETATNGMAEQIAETILTDYARLAHARLAPPSLRIDYERKTLLAEITSRLEAQDVEHLTEAVHESDVPTPILALAHEIVELIQREVNRETDLDVLIERMLSVFPKGFAADKYPIWRPPLPMYLTLEDLASQDAAQGWLLALVGRLDHPEQAKQPDCMLDLAGRDGNVLVLGSTNAGKTTFMRTLMLSLAFSHAPNELWMYTIDPAAAAAGLFIPDGPCLPHLAQALAPTDTAHIDRLCLELAEEFEHRRSMLQAASVDSLSQLRQKSTEPLPALLVIIENMAELMAASPDIVERLTPLMRYGRACGIHFVVSAHAWRDVAPIQNSFETCIALRLNDPNDSIQAIGRPFAAQIPREMPGRGYMRTTGRPVELQVARLPATAAGTTESHPLQQMLEQLKTRYQQITTGLPQALRMPPPHLSLASLADGKEALAGRLPIALDLITLKPLWLDLADSTPHLLMAGDPGAPAALILRTILSGLTQHAATEIRLLLVDYQGRCLREFADLPHAQPVQVAHAVPNSKETVLRPVTLIRNESELQAMVEYLLKEELPQRSQAGTAKPRLVLAIHNCDLLQGRESTLLGQLAPYLIQARDLGLHLFATGVEYGQLASSPLIRSVRTDRNAIYLGMPGESTTIISTFGIKPPRKPAGGLELSYGRGLFLRQGRLHLAQFALSRNDAAEETDHAL